MLKVKDHNKYRLFDYENEPSNTYQLGDVLLKKNEDEDSDRPEIGVVIQTFSDGDFRTDMWGMSSYSEVLRAKLSDVKEFRPDLLSDLIINIGVYFTTDDNGEVIFDVEEMENELIHLTM
jgi:hypothetical protein